MLYVSEFDCVIIEKENSAYSVQFLPSSIYLVQFCGNYIHYLIAPQIFYI